MAKARNDFLRRADGMLQGLARMQEDIAACAKREGKAMSDVPDYGSAD